MLQKQKEAEAREQFLSQMLSTHTVAKIAYDSQGKRPCDSDTRVDILKDIESWLYDISDGAQSFLWLTGDPGCGKSAVTASTAKTCKDHNILWAQFFINRNNVDTTIPASYFPSIARQLADRSFMVSRALHDSLKSKPSLMDDISDSQAGELFVNALKVAASTDSTKPVVVIIDGLDETDRSSLIATSRIFSKALLGLPSNVKVFISSRTEDDIRRPFAETFNVQQVKHIHLDTSDPSSISDVSTFLIRRVVEIVDHNQLNVMEWPGKERMDILCERAGGLFIWAVTTTRFIEDQIVMFGTECLDDVLDKLSSEGMGDINVLYGTILFMTHRKTTPWLFERFRQIVGCIVVLKEPLCIADISKLLDLKNPEGAGKPVDVLHFIRQLRTVLVAGTDAITPQTIPRLHKSFFEFITERAEGDFRVNASSFEGLMAVKCLYYLVNQSEIMQNQISSSLSTLLRYCWQFWTAHLPQIQGGTFGTFCIESQKRLPGSLQPSLSQLAYSSQPSKYLMMAQTMTHIISSSGDSICLWNPENGIPELLHLSGHSAPVLSVALSSDNQYIVSGSGDKTIILWDKMTGKPIRQPWEKHTDSVQSVAFSPDSKHVISGSDDHTLILWDVVTGTPVGYPYTGHNNAVVTVAFSPDSKHVISGSDDHTLQLWNIATGQVVGSPFKGHSRRVTGVAFSPDGKYVVSGSADQTIYLWDVESQSIMQTFKSLTSSVTSVAFSSNGKDIISGSSNNKLYLWDAATGQPVNEHFKGHSSWVTSVSFSPDGKHVVSGSNDFTLRLWDVKSKKTIHPPFHGHTDTVLAVAFSPVTGNSIVSGSMDKTLCLWDATAGVPAQFPLKRHTDEITCLAVSPDGTICVTASLDNSIFWWNIRKRRPIDSPVHIASVISMTFSPDGTKLASISLDGSCYLWKSSTHACIFAMQKFDSHLTGFESLLFSSKGRRLMLFNIDGTYHEWETATGKLSKPSSLLEGKKVQSFTMESGWQPGKVEGARIQWYPADHPDFGVWVKVDGKVIRKDLNGITTILGTD